MRRLFMLGLGLLSLWQVAVAQPKCDAHGVRTQVDIAAPPDTVWQLLLDVAQYPDWNPYIYAVEGELKQGKMLHFKMKKGDKDTREFGAKLLTRNEGKAFAWGGAVLFLFKARHYFTLEATPTGTRLVQGEDWGGWFGKGYGKGVYMEACANFEAMNAALKARAEARLH